MFNIALFSIIMTKSFNPSAKRFANPNMMMISEFKFAPTASATTAKGVIAPSISL